MFKIKNDSITEVTEMNVGNNIALLRKSKGITQDELAGALGVSAQAVSKWENNSSCPDVSLLTEIADFFGVSVDDLLRCETDDIIKKTASAENTTNIKNYKKKVVITVTQPSGKKNVIKIPFSFVKTGLKIGTVFGLSDDVYEKINSLVNDASITEFADIESENGDNVRIVLE